MSLRRRLALLSALAVAFAVLLASGLVYTLVRDRLRGDIDNDLRHQADVVSQRFTTAAPVIAGIQAQGATTGGAQAGSSASAQVGSAAGPGIGPPPGFPSVVAGKDKDEGKGKGKASHGEPPEEKPPTPKQIRKGGGRFLQVAVPTPGPGAPASLAQLIGPEGVVVTDPDSQYRIPVSNADRELATKGGKASLADVGSQGTDLRVLTQPLATGGAIQVA
ncbi:MAG TPA: hypothetical protein VHU24_11365, partial [Solirubrobacterales bacterium]|nr:hypothetical protein [Solirubrobacterales bacterium]